jgi:hypothetical protein
MRCRNVTIDRSIYLVLEFFLPPRDDRSSFVSATVDSQPVSPRVGVPDAAAAAAADVRDRTSDVWTGSDVFPRPHPNRSSNAESASVNRLTVPSQFQPRSSSGFARPDVANKVAVMSVPGINVRDSIGSDIQTDRKLSYADLNGSKGQVLGRSPDLNVSIRQPGGLKPGTPDNGLQTPDSARSSGLYRIMIGCY